MYIQSQNFVARHLCLTQGYHECSTDKMTQRNTKDSMRPDEKTEKQAILTEIARWCTEWDNTKAGCEDYLRGFIKQKKFFIVAVMVGIINFNIVIIFIIISKILRDFVC